MVEQKSDLQSLRIFPEEKVLFESLSKTLEVIGNSLAIEN